MCRFSCSTRRSHWARRYSSTVMSSSASESASLGVAFAVALATAAGIASNLLFEKLSEDPFCPGRALLPAEPSIAWPLRTFLVPSPDRLMRRRGEHLTCCVPIGAL